MADRSQDRILSAAIAAIAERGIEGLRTRDVAERAGVNISTLHYHFGTKEQLLLAVLDHVRATLASSLQQEAPTVRTARQALRAHFDAAFRTFRRNPDFATVLQELRVRARRDRLARDAFRAIQSQWNGIVDQILERAARDGEMRHALDPRAGAAVITSFIIGVTMQLSIDPKSYDVAAVTGELERWLFE